MLNSVSVAPQQHGHIGSVLPLSNTSNSSVTNLNNILGSPASSNTELLSAFECLVCMEYMLPPYLQCKSGHLLCGNCRPKVSFCPACRGETRKFFETAVAGPSVLTNNIFSEHQKPGYGENSKYASLSLQVQHIWMYRAPQPHSQSWSRRTLRLSVGYFPNHWLGRPFRPYSCPCPGASCKWQGALDDVMPHLMKSHKSITTLQGTRIQTILTVHVLGEDIVFLATDISLPGAVDWVMMQQCL